VVWVPDPGRWGPLPPDGMLGVKALPAAVARIGLQPGDPAFVSPDFTVDPGLLRHGRYCHGSVAGAVTRSKRDRTFYASVGALGQDGLPGVARLPQLASLSPGTGHTRR
jgi:hypothetical protein